MTGSEANTLGDRGGVREIWDVLPYHVGSSSLHFGLSDALVRSVRRPALWMHSADQPTLITGAGQSAAEIDTAAARAAGIAVVRRHAGGTSVLATPDVLGVDVAVPAGHPLALDDIVEAYRWLGGVWGDALRSLGADTRVVPAPEARAAQRGSTSAAGDTALRLACFGTLSPYEVAVGNRKLVGLAQVRRRTGVLWQSGIHLHFEAGLLATLICSESPEVLAPSLRERAMGLDEAVPSNLNLDDVRLAFTQTLQHRLCVKLEARDWTIEETRHAERVGEQLAV